MNKQVMDLKVDFGWIPDGWFLYDMKHCHTEVRYVDDIHEPIEWRCSLQRKPDGGCMVAGTGETPKKAMINAITSAKVKDL